MDQLKFNVCLSRNLRHTAHQIETATPVWTATQGLVGFLACSVDTDH
jgi:hypothetical protein